MPVRSGRLARLMRLGGMAAGVASDAAGAAGRVVARGGDQAAERFHRETAERLAGVLGEMKGLPQKVGQILSVLDDVIPSEYRDVYGEVLGRLQAASEPLTWAEVAPVVRAELGRDPEQLFVEVEEQAVAAASIGQVHRATLADGRVVAVKVQYPGIQAALQSDMANIGALVAVMSAALPRTSVEHLVQEVSSRFLEELDYVHEARAQQLVAERWADDPRIVVPAVVPELCSERVLTSEWVAGLSYEQALERSAVERGAWGSAMWGFTWRSVLEHSWVHGDPHPGNFRFLPHGRLAVLDYGASAELPQVLVQGLARVARLAVTGSDELQLMEALAPALGLPAVLDPEVARLWGAFAATLMLPVSAPQPFCFDRSYTHRLMEQTTEAKLVMARKALWKGVPTPTTSGTVLLMRTAVGQAAVLSRLEAQADFRTAAGLSR